MLTQLVLDMMVEKKVCEETFFQNAYFYRFGRDTDITNHVAQFKLHAIIPTWVVEYAKSLKMDPK